MTAEDKIKLKAKLSVAGNLCDSLEMLIDNKKDISLDFILKLLLLGGSDLCKLIAKSLSVREIANIIFKDNNNKENNTVHAIAYKTFFTMVEKSNLLVIDGIEDIQIEGSGIVTSSMCDTIHHIITDKSSDKIIKIGNLSLHSNNGKLNLYIDGEVKHIDGKVKYTDEKVKYIDVKFSRFLPNHSCITITDKDYKQHYIYYKINLDDTKSITFERLKQ